MFQIWDGFALVRESYEYSLHRGNWDVENVHSISRTHGVGKKRIFDLGT